MIQRILKHNPEHRDIIVIFLGWGADDRNLSSLHYPGCDIMAVWDYRDETFDTTSLTNYRHIYLFAWSMGIMMAERTLAANPDLRPTLSIAVNGSPCPVDNLKGIPENIFFGTLNGLSEITLKKFQRRMCRNTKEYADFAATAPQRSIAELRDELAALGERAVKYSSERIVPDNTLWDRAVIAIDDHIFPIENMRRAWHSLSRTRETSGGHLPDWQTIINQEIIDKEYVARKFQRSIPTYDSEAVAQKAIAAHLWKMWEKVLNGRTPLSMIEVGYGTGIMTRLYAPVLKPYRLMLWDLCPTEIDLPSAGEIIAGDAEELIAQLPENYIEAVVSTSAMQWFNSPSDFIANASRALSPGGQLVISTFGQRNMHELSNVTQLPLRYLTLDELVALLPKEMRLLAAEEDEIVMHFHSAKEVLQHMRATGVNGLRDANTSVSHILANYPQAKDNAPGVTLTYHPLYIIAEKQ